MVALKPVSGRVAMFGNPVDKDGRIQANTEPWKGSPTFRVTDTFQGHVQSGRGTGIDFGNGRCGDPVYSAAAGTIAQVLKDPGNGAIIVRIDHGNGYVTGYAHLAAIETKVGTKVARGIAIGHVGKTGATACHLHWGVNKNGVEIDGWPLLDQNIAIAGASEVVLGGNPQRLVNKKASTKLAGTNFRRDPSTTNAPLVQLPANTVFYPDFSVVGSNTSGSTVWYTGVLWTGSKQERGYLHASTVSALSAAETVATPAPPQDCGPAIKAATDPLQAQITTLNAAVAAQTKKIGDAKAALG